MPTVNSSIVEAFRPRSFGRRDEIPKIGGTEGGFIGLLVALIVIIIISATAVFFLLRTQGGGGRGHGHVSHFVHAGQDGSFQVQKSKWKGFRNLFRKRKNRNSGVRGGGWIPQVDDNDFDSESEAGIPLADSPTKSMKSSMKSTLMGSRDTPIQSLPPLPMRGGPEDISMSSVSLQALSRGGSKTPEPKDEPFSPPLTNAFHSRSPSPSPSPNLPHQVTPEPLPTIISLPDSQVESIPITPRAQLPSLKPSEDNRTSQIERKGTIDSVMSGHSTSSQYTSGSKFQEHIEF